MADKARTSFLVGLPGLPVIGNQLRLLMADILNLKLTKNVIELCLYLKTLYMTCGREWEM